MFWTFADQLLKWNPIQQSFLWKSLFHENLDISENPPFKTTENIFPDKYASDSALLLRPCKHKYKTFAQ